ncbi:MAG: alanine--tRNA ligase-related protein [Oscillospiraceae bacterium]|nr:alanine--tRNA ligase-related protein [Oscillospiraceae bacterium]
MPTRKLYYENAFTQTFQAAVLSCDAAGNGWDVVLDQTAFFPEGGGQTADTGRLGDAAVLDVHERGGLIRHRTDSPLPVGGTVEGQIDWPDRFRKMQNHSGEHIVSGIIHSRYGYENVGFHLGEGGCTVDFSGELTRAQLDEIEDAANAAVWADLPVTATFPPESELKALPYRSKLELTENVRIVTIPGIDICACCAPHVSSTGQIGLIKILDCMRHRGGIRLWMRSGRDALSDYRRRYEDTAALSALLNVPQEKIVPAGEKLLAQRDELKHQLTGLQRRQIEAQAAALEETPGSLALFVQGDDAAMRILANAGMEKCGGVCAVFSGRDGAYQFVMASRTADMRAFIKANGPALQARGGGQECMISGRCTATRADIETFFRTA